jgi:hypothetical protein
VAVKFFRRFEERLAGGSDLEPGRELSVEN